MFSIFKSKRQKLQEKRERLLKQAYQWSKIDRTKSDEFYADANAVDVELSQLG